jgi:Ca2+-binding EF-hand superfamily protein
VDLSGNGTISIEEYVRMCQTYGITFTEQDIDLVKAIADTQGEVRLAGDAYDDLASRFARMTSYSTSRGSTYWPS